MAARVNSSLAYPDRFYAAAAYAGFSNGSLDVGKVSKFQNDVALLLYGLYKQATSGPCNEPKPRAWNPVEHSKWTSWNGLGNMASTEAMRLFVKILEEEEPAWYSRVSEFAIEPTNDVEVNKPEVDSSVGAEPDSLNVNIPLEETKSISMDNGTMQETQDKDVIMEVLGSVDVYDQWIAPSVFGQRPKPRYEHGSALLQDKMYIFGGNHNGRYLSDLQVLDLRCFTWAKLEPKGVSPCAGLSMIPWRNKILSLGGHTKDPAETVTVKEFDPQTCMWSSLKTYGKPPISRGGQSVTLVGDTLVMFGGEDAKRSLLNDLHILDLETMTWDDMDTIGQPPSPRSDHAAACYADRHLLIFGGGSHSTVFNDLHILDLQTMEWSKPKQQGVTPGPRAGHAGATVGENWFIVGGGDNKNGASETLMLNMSTLEWSVVTTVQGRVPLASEGISLVSTTYGGDDFLVSFGGYNGRYSNEVFVLKLSNKSALQSNIDDSVSNTTVEDLKSESDAVQDGKIREIVVDNVGLAHGVMLHEADKSTAHEETGERLSLKLEKENLEAKLNQEQLQGHQLKEELAGAEVRNTQLTKELQSVRSQLAAEQSRCFKLEVDLAELRQKLQALETLEKEVELLRRQKAASEQAALNAKQKQNSGGVWGWIAGSSSEDSKS